MQESGTRSGSRASAAELLITLDRAASGSLRDQLERRLRELIRSGTLRAGTILPASRTLAADLGVSRRMVVAAYQQLCAEGYLSSHQRSVTRVGQIGPVEPRANPPAEDSPPARYDLRPSVPALAEFPRAAWLKAMTTAITTTPAPALGYPDPAGTLALRRAVADYLRRVRAVAAEADNVVICAGFTQALALLTQTMAQDDLIQNLRRPLIALENPGLIGRDATIAAAGGRHIAVAVDEHGLRTDQLPDTNADAVVVTPAHQFPLGAALPPRRRAELLDWARARRNRLVIEDDYDAEFRYDRAPLGALQGLAPTHVAYIGTVSKTLAPALRLGWLVLPHRLLDPVVHAKRHHDAGNPTLDQRALAHLIDSGGYERHLRRTRRVYQQRRDHLVTALHRHLPTARVSGAAAGLHLLARLPAGPLETDVITTTAARHDIAVTALSRYHLPDTPCHDEGLVIGYANIIPTTIDAAIQQLAQAISAR